MDQIIDNLWIGDLPSALNGEKLKEHNIGSVLSAMRGRVSIQPTFVRMQVNLDDTEDADVLAHLVSAILFVEAELEKGRGVLVHCQAGLSRSVTIVAAYLMYSLNIDTDAALEMIRQKRPNVQPNNGFMEQLEIFHEASFKVSRRDKATRMFYLERVVKDVMNGDGSVETDMFAKYPRTPTDSVPPTPGGPRRRIRCKMCRQELATREHMLDHGQLGPATPASAITFSPAGSRRPSMHDVKPLAASSMLEGRPLAPLTPLTSISPPMSRRPSSHDPSTRPRLGSTSDTRPLRSSLLALNGAAQLGQELSDSLSESALEGEDEDEEGDEAQNPQEIVRPRTRSSAAPEQPSGISPMLYANPKLAALRSPPALNMTPLSASGAGSSSNGGPGLKTQFSPPILANPKCSGYFVEPMKWMESFLEDGQLAGKILCPNKKCGAKLGNYDWAGVCCSCKEWVVPGFCIHRSKVDEVV
ncbi:hypothetical protein B0H21DRAFT_778859 [Amylocystis lapponica]|nr:hypothetical protein B0H21DRAFT_778859 [Amylocystis lapponica]